MHSAMFVTLLELLRKLVPCACKHLLSTFPQNAIFAKKKTLDIGSTCSGLTEAVGYSPNYNQLQQKEELTFAKHLS